MTQSQRRSKKTVIATIYAMVILSFVALTVFSLWPAPRAQEVIQGPTPDPLEVTVTETLPLAGGKADLVAIISNPNDGFGVKEFTYQFVLENPGGEQQTVSGRSFILPGDRQRAVVALNYTIENYQLTDFIISPGYSWSPLSRTDLPELIVRGVDVGISDKVGNFFTLSGVITNRSPYNLKQIELIGIITNQSDEIIAVNRTFVRDVLDTEAREFEMIWNDPIQESRIDSVTVYPYSNVLDNEEFLLRQVDGPIDPVGQ